MSAITCSECWTTIPSGTPKCPRCGAKATGAPPSVVGLLKSYPWLIVVLSLSALVTLWAATRRAPVPVQVVIPPAEEQPAAQAPKPEPEADVPMPPPQAPAPETAPAPAPVQRSADAPSPPSAPTQQNPDGTWGGGPGLSRP